MAGPVQGSGSTSFGSTAGQPGDDTESRLRNLREDAKAAFNSAEGAASPGVGQLKDSLSDLGNKARDTADATVKDAKASVGAALPSLKDQANQAAGEARGAVASIADEARQRIAALVDQQKTAGADTVSGVARAAQAAAGDLEQTSPQMARLVRSAADNVDRIAGDIRSSDLNSVLATLSDFGRRQPVAFFGGAVLAGFLLARFLKTDQVPTEGHRPYNPAGSPGRSSGLGPTGLSGPGSLSSPSGLSGPGGSLSRSSGPSRV